MMTNPERLLVAALVVLGALMALGFAGLANSTYF